MISLQGALVLKIVTCSRDFDTFTNNRYLLTKVFDSYRNSLRLYIILLCYYILQDVYQCISVLYHTKHFKSSLPLQ